MCEGCANDEIDFCRPSCNNVRQSPRRPSAGANATRSGCLMSKVELHPVEAVLSRCGDGAPSLWHPQQYARRSGVPLDQLNDVIKQLWDDGLLEKGPAHPDHGPGL